MTITQADLDGFREGYDDLGYEGQREFYERVAEAFPDQEHVAPNLVDEFLRWCKPRTIVELGGWDGDLARRMLAGHPEIERWVNYEIAPVQPVCTDPRYEHAQPEGWAWEQELEADAFIASHVLEHLTAEHLDALLAALRCQYAYVDVPLPEQATDWKGDPSTHVLTLSLAEFDERWQKAGFKIAETRKRSGGYYGGSSVRYLAHETAAEPAPLTRTHPPGTIIIAAGEFLRYGAFLNSMLQVLHPPDTSILIRQGLAVVENLNDCIRKMTGEWVWIQADDQSWQPDALVKLLERDVDVVVPLILKRSPPYHPVAFKEFSEEGFLPYQLHELPETGLLPIVAAGSGGMLIRKHVLDALGDPWFTYGSGEHLNEDLMLCRRIIEAGFDIWLDVEVQLGHRSSYTVLPVLSDEGRWGIGLNLGATSNGKSNTLVLHPNDILKEEVVA